MKKIKILMIAGTVIVVLISLLLLIRMNNTLSGTYMSESGNYSVSFKRNGTCIWYEDDMVFLGEYKKLSNNTYYLTVSLGILDISTTFTAKTESPRSMAITGGTVHSERFIKTNYANVIGK